MGKMAKMFGTGLGLAAAATAGAFLLYKKNDKVRKTTGTWAARMKKEILKSLQGLKQVNKENYHEVVQQVSARYAKMKDVNATELKGLVADLKQSWAQFSKDLSSL